MNILPGMIKDFGRQIIPIRNQIYSAWMASALIGLASSALVVIWGGYAFAIPLIIITAFLMIRNNAFILAFYFAAIPFIMVYYFDYYIAVSIVLALMVIGIWFSRIAFGYEQRRSISNFLIIYSMAYLILALISILNGGVTDFESKTLIRLIIFFGFAYAIYDLIRPRDVFLIMIAATIPLILAAFTIAREYFGSRNLIELLNLYRMKPGGVLPSSNAAGYLMMVVAPFWIAISIWYRGKSVRVVSTMAATILVLAVGLTNARASIFGLAISGIMFFIWTKKLKRLIFISIAALIVLVSVPYLWNLISLGLRFERGMTSRDVIWKNTLEMIENNPILGVGPGNYAASYVPYFETGWECGFNKTMPNAHFFILHMVAELGIGGLFLATILFIWPPREFMFALRKVVDPEDKAIIYGVFGGILAIYGHSFFEAGGIIGSGRPYGEILFWLFLSILIKINNSYSIPAKNIFFGPRK